MRRNFDKPVNDTVPKCEPRQFPIDGVDWSNECHRDTCCRVINVYPELPSRGTIDENFGSRLSSLHYNFLPSGCRQSIIDEGIGDVGGDEGKCAIQENKLIVRTTKKCA